MRRLGYEAGGRLPNDEQMKYSCANGSNCLTMDNNLNICHHKYPASIPGVFNCRFSNPVGNGAARRKKKKPTTFVPPPNLTMQQQANLNLSNGQTNEDNGMPTIASNGLMSIPFWRRPVSQSQTGGS